MSNSIDIRGNLVADAETKHTQGGTLLTFRLADNHTWKDASGQQQKKTTFIDCEMWGKSAESISPPKKGDAVIVLGRLEQDEWQDKQTGSTRSKHKIRVYAIAVIQYVPRGQDQPCWSPPQQQAPQGWGPPSQQQQPPQGWGPPSQQQQQPPQGWGPPSQQQQQHPNQWGAWR